MYETQDGYVFITFQDNKVIFYKDNYKKHCGYHDEIRGERGRENIQNTLINPNHITSYVEKNKSGKIIAHCKIYRTIINKITTSRGEELEYWEIILRQKLQKRKKIATAYIASAPRYAMINNRIEKLEYPNKKTVK